MRKFERGKLPAVSMVIYSKKILQKQESLKTSRSRRTFESRNSKKDASIDNIASSLYTDSNYKYIPPSRETFTQVYDSRSIESAEPEIYY